MARLELEIGIDVLLLETGDALLLEIPVVAPTEGGAQYIKINPFGVNLIRAGGG